MPGDINFGFDTTGDFQGLVKNLREAAGYAKQIKASLGDPAAYGDSASIAKQINELERLRKTVEKKKQQDLEAEGILGSLIKRQKELRLAQKAASDPNELKKYTRELKNVNKQVKDAKDTTAGWGKALGSFAFKFNALGNIAANVLSAMTRQAKEFIAESVKMATKAEGISAAFQKLNQPDLLNNLRQATRGTVNDMELMQRAVQANNFKIPLDQLATYFKFATNRAIETGESVDYLVESIITGIGRKSVLVMDNLGISAVELQEETKKVGDFGAAAGNIIQREIGAAGTVADTAATSFGRLKTQFDNIKLALGDVLIDVLVPIADKVAEISTRLKELKDESDPVVNSFNSIIEAVSTFSKEDQIKLLTKKTEDLKKVSNELWEEKKGLYETIENGSRKERKEAEDRRDEINILVLGYDSLIAKLENRITLIDELAKKEKDADDESEVKIGVLKKLNEDLEFWRKKQLQASEDELGFINMQIQRLEDLRKKYQELGKATEIKEIKLNIKGDGDLLSKIEKDIAGQMSKSLNEDLDESEEERHQNNLDRWEEEKEVFLDKERRKREAVRMTFDMASNFSSALANIVQANKEKELSAVGDNAEKREAIEREYAKKQQGIAIMEALISTARGAVETYEKLGFPLAIPFIAAGTAFAGLQIAAIKSQKFAKGGYTGDGTMKDETGERVAGIVHEKEFVINKRQTAKYRDLLEAINKDQASAMFSPLMLDLNKKNLGKKTENWDKKLYELMNEKESGYETNEYYVITKGNTKTVIPKKR